MSDEKFDPKLYEKYLNAGMQYAGALEQALSDAPEVEKQDAIKQLYGVTNKLARAPIYRVSEDGKSVITIENGQEVEKSLDSLVDDAVRDSKELIGNGYGDAVVEGLSGYMQEMKGKLGMSQLYQIVTAFAKELGVKVPAKNGYHEKLEELEKDAKAIVSGKMDPEKLKAYAEKIVEITAKDSDPKTKKILSEIYQRNATKMAGFYIQLIQEEMAKTYEDNKETIEEEVDENIQKIQESDKPVYDKLIAIGNMNAIINKEVEKLEKKKQQKGE